ncbi:MAG: alpha/beta hydrolase [Prolixibacteraceae bacterium]|jgi:acetyl esterase|nr:alpha/beta hydrolase [Prolixibacteraceae bacterium]MBT6006429.1 alpha/beta hydrolase [Prolixibacteraceae bacterium]MBT6767016.1 alpha/beta hydrolase [Prolixibacteraceae bacterium]MBT6999403.1 alpha/beta hydrolase [Prolixibacteraceae bacterium]MBT7394297.1 alpha/beta hydrolase [Prolixibacteraceae bacterium]
MKPVFYILSIFLFLTVTGVQSQNYEYEKSTLTYKEIDGHLLEMIIYKPKMPTGIKLPAIVFFFGGGWVGGTTSHFELQAKYFATRGIVAICPDYRTYKSHKTTPFESVKDARSSMRYLKKYGSDLGIDTNKIVASGGSAGGHLAASTAIIDDINEESDDLLLSPKPFALALFNPVVDTGKKGYGKEKMNGREFEISPVHQITSELPPTIILHGKNDKTVPYENVVRFKHLMKQEGNKCILVGYKKQEHGFFNYNKKPKYFKKTLLKTESFLEDYNLLKGESWVKKYYKELKNNS